MAPSHEDKIKNLKLKRAVFKLELERVTQIVESYNADPKAEHLRLNISELKSEYAIFTKNQPELDAADDTGEYIRERLDIRAQYFQCPAAATELLNEEGANPRQDKPEHSVQNATRAENAKFDHIILPCMQLPQFRGRYEDWPGFSDQFRITVHDNPRLTDCQKLMYLRSCLPGEAAKSIELFANAPANYLRAWELLSRLYNKPATIAATHVHAIFNMPTVPRSSHRELRSFLTQFEAHYRALQSLGQPSADTLLIHLCLSRLDTETNIKWREHSGSISFPDL